MVIEVEYFKSVRYYLLAEMLLKVIDTICQKIVKLHLEQKDSFKDLRIIVDEKVSFREHINEEIKHLPCWV